MDIQSIIIIIVASLVGLVYLLIIRGYDIYEKEKYWKLLLVAILGGTLSIILSLFFYSFLDVHYNFIDAIIKIGPVEEISKLISLIIIYQLIKSEFNEIVDGLIYIAAISLGFSIIENIFYAFKSTDPYLILFERSIFSVLGHISFSGYLGLAFFIHVKVKRNLLGLILASIIASFAHGLYDAVLFHKEINILFRFVFYGILFLQFFMFKLALGFSSYRKPLSKELFEQSDSTMFLLCVYCNSSIKGKKLKFWKINGLICNNCNRLVLQGENIAALLKYFRPSLNIQRFLNNMPVDKKIIALDENNRIIYNKKRTILTAPIPELSDWLISSNRLDRKKILELPILGVLLLYLGLRYLDS